mmetsp:Transcript_10798/g.41894  ORF Transcript_10798/g.41894 Transcript_10798/m.41894 type:complete len:209 (-) Transcript_10798:444-1070(-)
MRGRCESWRRTLWRRWRLAARRRAPLCWPGQHECLARRATARLSLPWCGQPAAGRAAPCRPRCGRSRPTSTTTRTGGVTTTWTAALRTRMRMRMRRRRRIRRPLLGAARAQVAGARRGAGGGAGRRPARQAREEARTRPLRRPLGAAAVLRPRRAGRRPPAGRKRRRALPWWWRPWRPACPTGRRSWAGRWPSWRGGRRGWGRRSGPW